MESRGVFNLISSTVKRWFSDGRFKERPHYVTHFSGSTPSYHTPLMVSGQIGNITIPRITQQYIPKCLGNINPSLLLGGISPEDFSADCWLEHHLDQFSYNVSYNSDDPFTPAVTSEELSNEDEPDALLSTDLNDDSTFEEHVCESNPNFSFSTNDRLRDNGTECLRHRASHIYPDSEELGTCDDSDLLEDSGLNPTVHEVLDILDNAISCHSVQPIQPPSYSEIGDSPPSYEEIFGINQNNHNSSTETENEMDEMNILWI